MGAKISIRAHPNFQAVSPGAIVSYFAEVEGRPLDETLEGYRFRWTCVNDPASRGWFVPRAVSGPRARHWREAEWDVVGRHTIVLEVERPDGIKEYHSREQWVDSAASILGRDFDPSAKVEDANPFQVARDHERYLDTLRKVAEQKPPPEDKKEEYEDRLEKREAYLKHLKFMLDGLDGKEAYVVRGMHLDAKRSMRTPLNLWLVNLTADKRDHHWVLVDWTNPSHESTSGKYEAEEDSSEEAIEALLEAWDKDNSYPPGRIEYQFSVPERDLFFDDGFDTDGASFWDEVSAWLDYLALGAAVVAGVVTLIAPVPGSRVISAGIWASIFASTTAATINIAQRYAQGRSNWKDDAFDGLSIVGNLFAAAGVAWKVGATVTSTAGRLGPKMSKAVLIGQISSDGMQGILLSAQHVDDYNKIMDDGSLAPDERLNKLLELFRSASIAATMTALSMHGAKADIDNLNAGNTRVSRADLETEGTVVDLDTLPDPTPEIPAGTKRVEQEVEVEPKRAKSIDDVKKVAPAPPIKRDHDFTKRLLDMVEQDMDAVKAKNGMKTPPDGYSTKKLKWKKATSRAGLRPDTDTITEQFFNIDGMNLRFTPENISGGKPPGTRHLGGDKFDIPDIDAYLKNLEDEFRSFELDGKALRLELHPKTKGLIKTYLEKSRGKPLSTMDGLPGTHAEVVAVNDLFWKLEKRGIDLESLEPADIEVATRKVGAGKSGLWEEFPACANCTGILAPFTVHTGTTP